MGALLCKPKEEAKSVSVPNLHEVSYLDKGTCHSVGVDKSADYLEFPFIVDYETGEHVKCSKLMFILRGLPGSGKSTIAREIKRLYKEAAVCSADEYFYSGCKHELNASRLEFAHQLCQERAEEACHRGTNVIIIDNTNICRWQMKHYICLAKISQYSVIVVEPQTPWKLNPEILAKNNIHGVAYDVLVTKVDQWEIVLPLYYGWFLNEAGSRMLILIGQAYLEECLKVPAFEDDFNNHCNTTESKDIFDYYKESKNLHCTAKYCGSNFDDAVYYSNTLEVMNGYGRCFEICIIGLVMTPRTFGARVKLDEEQIKLWDNDTQESSSRSNVHSNNVKMTDQTQGLRNSDPLGNDKSEERSTFTCQIPLVCMPQKDLSFQPTKGLGSRAHVTLGCAHNISPVTTGLDLLEVVNYESQMDNSIPIETFELSRGVLRRYGTSSWVLYLNQKIYVKTIFTGFY